MGSSLTLKNDIETEFTISHTDGSYAKSIAGKDIAVAVDTVNDFPLNPQNGDVVIVRDLDRGGTFIYDSTETANSNGCTNFNGWVRQYSGAINVKWFGAKGDGVTDDTLAIQAALNVGGNITGDGVFYTTSTLDIKPNTTISIKLLSTASIVLSSTGTEGTSTSLTASINSGAVSCDVTSVDGFNVDGYAFIKSNGYWSPATSDNVKMGEYVRIKSIVGATITFYASIIGDYLTTDSAVILPVSLNENIILNNVVINGSLLTDNQTGVKFTNCGNIEINNISTFDFDYVHIIFERCVNYRVIGGNSSKTGAQEGLDYGVAHSNGCYNGLVTGYSADSIRHVSTIGGSEGISRFITVDKCFGYNLSDAGIDSHSAVYEHSFTGNYLHFGNTADTTADGIICGGGNPTISGNIIVGARRHGVLYQSLIASNATARQYVKVSDNNITGNDVGLTTAAINIAVGSGAGFTDILGVNISNNIVSAFDYGIAIDSSTDGGVEDITVIGNTVSGALVLRGIYVTASDNQINNLVIVGNNIKATTNEVIYLAGDADTSINNVLISDNRLSGGTYSIRTINTQNGIIKNNLMHGYSSGRYSIDSLSSLLVDNDLGEFVTVSGSSTYTLNAKDTNIIVNRAATVTLTLPLPSAFIGKTLNIKTVQAFAVDSASANVVPINDTVAGASILPATDGAWAVLKSDGTNWVVVQKG